jgi:hypothetical protein
MIKHVLRIFRTHSKLLALVVARLFFGLDDSLLLGVIIANVSNIGIVAIEDPSNLLKSRALGFHVEEVNEDELDSNPNLIF